MVVDLGRYRKFVKAAWMYQHTGIPKKPRKYGVFTTPQHSKTTSKEQTKN